LKVLQVLVALLLPLVLLIGNVQLLAHPRFVHYEYGRAGFPPDTVIPAGGYPLPKLERTALAVTGIESIIGPKGMQVLEDARFERTNLPAFNAREIGHMQDVRALFQKARVFFWGALVVLVGGGLLLAWHGGRRALTQPLFNSVRVALSLAGALGLYIVLSFNTFFTQFHHLFFAGSTWLFRRDDTLIRLYPTDFWFDAAFFIAGLTILQLVLVGLWAWWWGRRDRAPEPALQLRS
jgi:integral membrane protein (TIGR01906 family)